MHYSTVFRRVQTGESQGEIVVGDCLDVMAQMPDGCVDLVVTDPPYRISCRKNIKRSWRKSDLAMDFGDQDKTYQASRFLPEILRVCKGAVAIFVSDEVFGETYKIVKDHFDYCRYIVWEKTNPAPQIHKVTWRQSTELILHGHDKGDINWLGQREMRNLLRGTTCAHESLGHPSQKPMWLIRELLSRVPGDLIFDPFMGSGTTAVVADRLGRKFFGCDINPDYAEMALRRLEKDRAERQLELF